ncbi:hypothetical protein H0H87_011012 [Tephrocybe sp. NHM501043]|nr:hypothetical protein H0H87_011012 [Tephrocybe sp. NHM501043]
MCLISISLAPPQEPVVEPYSPFSAAFTSPDDDDAAFRPVHLTPPPTLTKFSPVPKPLSPLRPSDTASPAKGLERERFEALLQASRERNSALGSRKENDLRKEIALRAHKNKHVERRSLFLSKVLAPPSPTATLTPKTPPDSPAIFHYSLPSPGLVSPLALFESLNDDHCYRPFSYGREPWIECVDFRTPEHAKVKEPPSRRSSGRPLPSLDQISAHMSSQTHVRSRVGEAPVNSLPPTACPDRPRLQLGVGRLQMPVRGPKQDNKPIVIPPVLVPKISKAPEIRPKLPSSSLAQPNIAALSPRERRAHDMLSTLRRRTSSFEQRLDGVAGDDRGAKWKRHSAPADILPLRERSGFEHPVLALPGGF